MDNNEPIFDFPRTKQALKRRGIEVGDAEGYKILRPADVVFKDGKGNVEFTNNKGDQGIFAKDNNGHYRQVYMYMPDYKLDTYGKPRYHICKCTKIQEFIDSGGFREHYRYANTNEVKVHNLDRFRQETVCNDLPLCGYCASMIYNKFPAGMPLEKFVDILKAAGEADKEKEAQEVDIFGYVKNWQEISEAKRELDNYTCEQCGYHADGIFDRRFIHIHHKDGDKLNNNASNLQCLCIKCHANVDARHQSNFSRGAQAEMLQEFENHLKVLNHSTEVHYHIDHVDTLNIGDNVEHKYSTGN